MKNTPENKARFFAQYWGQRVMKSNEWMAFEGSPILVNPTHSPAWGIWYLDLKPLSQITDEDAIEVVKKIHISNSFPQNAWKINRKPGGIWLTNSIDDDYDTFLSSGQIEAYYDANQDLFTALSVTDFLRSKGYALPWLGISVEQQVEFGWVKLKEEKL